jgi:hypothetical protein
LEDNSIKEPQSVDVAPFLIPHLNFDEIIFHEPDPLGTSQVPVVTNELKDGDLTLKLYLAMIDIFIYQEQPRLPHLVRTGPLWANKHRGWQIRESGKLLCTEPLMPLKF